MSADEEENMDDMLTDDYDESDIDTNQENSSHRLKFQQL